MEEEKTTDSTTTASAMPKKGGGQPSASEETASPYPQMDLAQEIHKILVKADGADFAKVMQRIVTELENPSLYRYLQTAAGGSSTGPLLSEEELKGLEEKNVEALKELEQKVEEAKENAGDMEVMDARVTIARFAAKSLSKEEALKAYQDLLDVPKVSSGKKIDAMMESSRIASFYGDQRKSASFIDSVRFTRLWRRFGMTTWFCLLS